MTELENRRGSKKGVLRKFHYGLVTVSDGKSRPQSSRIKLCSDYITLQREEFHIWEDEDTYNVEAGLRTITLPRAKDGTLGISIKGGSEYNLPILVSRVTSECEKARDIFIGDAVVQVNDHVIGDITHDEALSLLASAGSSVTLVLKHYKAATPFLLKQFGRYIPEFEPGMGSEDIPGPGNESIPNSCSDDDGPFPCSQSSQIIPDSPCSVNSDCSGSWIGIPRIKKNWIDVVTVPLLMSYMTRYIFGTDKLRPNAFEVRGMDGSSTGVIHHEDPTLLTQMTKLISDYIGLQNAHQAAKLNRSFSSTNQITFMTWVAEGIINNDQPWQNWKPRFLALRGSSVYVFDSPPLRPEDWDNESSDSDGNPNVIQFKMFEAMFRVIKESENVDERQHCFLIQAFGKQSHYFSVETRQELLRLESAWHKAVCLAISHLGSKTFHVVYKNKPSAFTLDWEEGFSLKCFACVSPEWTYQFSQLKGSSDDGNATLKLHFSRPLMQDTVTEEIICPKLQELLFFMHSFLTAKVASLDPSFLPSKS